MSVRCIVHSDDLCRGAHIDALLVLSSWCSRLRTEAYLWHTPVYSVSLQFPSALALPNRSLPAAEI